MLVIKTQSGAKSGFRNLHFQCTFIEMPFLQYCQILTEIVDRAVDSKDKKEYTS